MATRPHPSEGALTDLLFDDELVGRCLVAPDGTILRANAEWLRSAGLALDEVLGERLVDLFPETREVELEMHARARAGERVEVPGHARHIHGRETWWQERIAPVPMEGGTGLLVTALATPQHAAAADEARRERAFPYSATVLDHVGEMAHLGAWWTELTDDPERTDRTALFWSNETYRIFGYAPGAVKVTNGLFFERVHPDDRQKVRDAVARSIAERRPYTTEHRILRPDGGERVVLEYATATFDAQGRATRLIGAVQDITEAKRGEQEREQLLARERVARQGAESAARALAESEARFRAMGETLPYGVWLANPRGGAEYVSQSFLDLLEMTPEQQREFGWTHRLPPEDVEPMLRKWLRCVRTGEMWDSEHRVLGPDGKYHFVLTRGLPVRDAEGNITCWVGINLDIDKRKEMEEQLRDADRRKDEFLGVLSHELRNPLAPIRNSIYILEHADPGGEHAVRAREVIERQTNHLTRLVDDLLDVTRIARGKVALRRERLDLRDVARRTAEDHRSLLEGRGVALTIDLPREPCWLEADATRLAQIVGNLLQNSAKFTGAGGAVSVTVRARPDAAEVLVRDTGAGIDPGLIARIFEPFTQGTQELARPTGGLGLGLALVKGLTELHGGTVEARSEGHGRGAEFLVRLPVTTSSTAARPSAPSGVSLASRGLRVLVVDDNRDAAESLALIVEMFGHAVTTAFDGPAAVAAVRANPPDVVLCDIGLPGMSGYDVARTLRAALGAGIQLVAVTGYAQPEDVKAAVEAGFDRHISKPISPDDVERLLGSTRAPRR